MAKVKKTDQLVDTLTETELQESVLEVEQVNEPVHTIVEDVKTNPIVEPISPPIVVQEIKNEKLSDLQKKEIEAMLGNYQLINHSPAIAVATDDSSALKAEIEQLKTRVKNAEFAATFLLESLAIVTGGNRHYTRYIDLLKQKK